MRSLCTRGRALFVACFALLSPAIARAQAPANAASPVTIAECRILHDRSFVAPYRSIEIVFANRSSGIIDEVRFAVVYDGRTERIVDAGSFSPGAVIRHDFAAFRNAPYEGPVPGSCEVEYARFRDGTVWART